MTLREPDIDSNDAYPWHDAQWVGLMQDPGRLGHALLLSGQPGLGKYAFARRLAGALLCAHPQQPAQACGTCKSCLLNAAGTHPDLALVEPLEQGKAITVDQVRALVDFATTRPHTAERKVVIISPAELMNLNAANSLLKLLEEPPLGNVLLLVSSEPAKLPATVRSRCQRVEFKPPPRRDALAWLNTQTPDSPDAAVLLELAGGAPIRALQLAQSGFLLNRNELVADIEALSARQADPVSCAAHWHKLGAELCLGWFHGLITDLIKLGMVGRDATPLANADLASHLQGIAAGLNLRRLYRFADAVAETRDLLATPLDDLLLLEDILILWTRVTRK